MVIYLAGEVDEEAQLDEMSPRQIVTELDKHVVGQRNAKRAVAIALRNRVRRQKLPPESVPRFQTVTRLSAVCTETSMGRTYESNSPSSWFLIAKV